MTKHRSDHIREKVRARYAGKAMQVAAGVALPKDVTLKITAE